MMQTRTLLIIVFFFVTLFMVGCATNGIYPGSSGPPSVDVTGRWKVASIGKRYSDHEVFYLTQSGNSITGSSLRGGRVRGSISGNSITLRRGEGTGPVIYTGTVNSDAMQGEFKFADGKYYGTWTATKVD